MRTFLPIPGISKFILKRCIQKKILSSILVMLLVLPFQIEATDVGGPITSNTTWAFVNSPYVLTSDVTVNLGVTLTIEPGVQVEFPNLAFDLTVNGTLTAIGSVADTIKFLGTGTFGGGSVYINSASTGSAFDYAFFSSLGVNGSSAHDCALRLDAVAQVSHCVFTMNSDDVRAGAAFVSGFDSTNSLEDINFYGNSLTSSAVWPKAGQPGYYYNFLGDQSLPAGEVLTVMPGAEIRLPNLAFDLIINGQLLAVGTPVDSIKFYGSGAFDGGSVAILSQSVGSEIRYARFDSLGTNGSSHYDCALFLEAETIVSNSSFSNNTDDVRGRATAFGGFINNNSLEDINVLSNSLDTSAIWPDADVGGFHYNLFGDQTIPAGDTLTINPGVDIHFANLAFDLLTDGTLLANGTPVDSIRFLGIGTFGGGSVLIDAGSEGSSISYARFNRMGINASSNFDAGLYIRDFVSVANCQFTNNTNDVIADADKVSGFASTNSLLDINILNNSLNTNSVWPNADATGFHYNLLGDQTVPVSNTLTINPGVDIHFANLAFDLHTNGTLIANGTPTDSIRFLGIGTFGGGSVYIGSGSEGSSISFARFDRLGINGSSAYDSGLYLLDTTSVANCQFTNNLNDVIADADMVSGFESSNSLLDINLLSNSLDTNSVWPNADATGFYYNLLGDVTAHPGDTLIINADVEVHFANLAFDLIIDGTLFANGANGAEIRFIGIGGNGGGSVAIGDMSVGSVISYCHFENLGVNGSSNFDTALYVDAQVAVNNSTFINNSKDVRADADDVGGFDNNNSLEDINFLNNSLSTTSTWPNADATGFYYSLEGDLTLPSGETLTIEPGVETQFNGLTLDLFIGGTLLANGTVTEDIRFIGVGANGGGSVVIQTGSSGSSIDYCYFEGLGISASSSFDTALFLEEEVAVSNSNFVNNGKDVRGRADAMAGFESTNSLEDIEFTFNSLAKTSVWPNADAGGFFYRMTADQSVLAGDTLTILPGVTVDFFGLSIDLNVSGTLLASGTDTQPITMHSTNGNGGGSILLAAGSTGHHLHKVTVDRLGENTSSAHDSGIKCLVPDALIKRCNIKNSIYGITIDYTAPMNALQVANPVIRRNIIETNSSTGIRVLNGTPVVRFNSIINNTSFGLTNTLSNDQVDACDNWWGDPSGPFNATSNPTGLGNAVTDNVLYFNCWLTSLPDVFLAVELIDFTAILTAEGVKLSWSTASETGHDYFEIEKSQDGITFEHFARVESQGLETGLSSYHLLDNGPFFGENYYRLKIVDENGFYEYSNVELVFVEKWLAKTIEIMPNPFSTALDIYLDVEITEIAKVNIFDVLGRLQFSQTYENVQHKVVINSLHSLNPGNYYIVIETASGVLSQKLLKH